MTTSRPDRRGAAMVPAMVCLVLVVMLCAAMLRQAHARRSVLRAEERRMQAEWLAESGAARAMARLAADRKYQGETWEIAEGTLGGGAPGVVRIAVETVEKEAGRRRVRVEADYPAGETHRARQTKRLTVDLGPENSGGPS